MENTGTSSSLTEKSILITFITTNILFWNLYSSRGNIAAIVARRRMRMRPHLQRELKVYFQQNKAKESKPPINNTWIAIQSFREENNPTELNKYDIDKAKLDEYGFVRFTKRVIIDTFSIWSPHKIKRAGAALQSPRNYGMLRNFHLIVYQACINLIYLPNARLWLRLPLTT